MQPLDPLAAAEAWLRQRRTPATVEPPTSPPPEVVVNADKQQLTPTIDSELDAAAELWVKRKYGQQQLTPDTNSELDAAAELWVKRKYGQQSHSLVYNPSVPHLYAPDREAEYQGAFGKLRRLWDTGVGQTQRMLGRGLEASAAPDSAAYTFGQELISRSHYRIPEDPGLLSIEDIKNPLDIADFIVGHTVANVPNMAVTALGYTFGGAPGGFFASYLLNKGESYDNLLELGVPRVEAQELSEVGGVVKGALDLVSFRWIMTAAGLKPFWLPKDIPLKVQKEIAKEASTSAARRILETGREAAKAGLTGFTSEAVTEGGQEFTDILLEKYAKVYDTPGMAWSRVLNAAAAGGAAGGTMAGGGRLITHPIHRKMVEAEERKKQEAGIAPVPAQQDLFADHLPAGSPRVDRAIQSVYHLLFQPSQPVVESEDSAGVGGASQAEPVITPEPTITSEPLPETPTPPPITEEDAQQLQLFAPAATAVVAETPLPVKPVLTADKVVGLLPTDLQPEAIPEVHLLGAPVVGVPESWILSEGPTDPATPIVWLPDQDGEVLAEIYEAPDPMQEDPMQGVYQVQVLIPDQAQSWMATYGSFDKALQAAQFVTDNIIHPFRRLAPEQIRNRVRNQVLALPDGSQLLFKEHTADQIIQYLDLQAETGLTPLIEVGLLQDLGNGRYKFTEYVAGNLDASYQFLPAADFGPGVSYSPVANDVRIVVPPNFGGGQLELKYDTAEKTWYWPQKNVQGVLEDALMFTAFTDPELFNKDLNAAARLVQGVELEYLTRRGVWKQEGKKHRFSFSYLGGEVTLEFLTKQVFYLRASADHPVFPRLDYSTESSAKLDIDIWNSSDIGTNPVSPFELHDLLYSSKRAEDLAWFAEKIQAREIPFAGDGFIEALRRGTPKEILTWSWKAREQRRTQGLLFDEPRHLVFDGGSTVLTSALTEYFNRPIVKQMQQEYRQLAQMIWDKIFLTGLFREAVAAHFPDKTLAQRLDYLTSDPSRFDGLYFSAPAYSDDFNTLDFLGVYIWRLPFLRENNSFRVGFTPNFEFMLDKGMSFDSMFAETLRTIVHEFTHSVMLGHADVRQNLEDILSRLVSTNADITEATRKLKQVVAEASVTRIQTSPAPAPKKLTAKKPKKAKSSPSTPPPVITDPLGPATGPDDSLAPPPNTKPEFFENHVTGDFPANSISYRDAVSQIDPGIRFEKMSVPTEAPISEEEKEMLRWYHRLARHLRGAKTDPLRRKKFQVAEGWTRMFFRQTKEMMTLLQLEDQFPDVWQLQAFSTAMRNFGSVKTKTLQIGNGLLEQWQKMNSKSAMQASKLLLTLAERSFKAKRRLTPQEIEDTASRLGLKNKPQVVQFALDIERSLNQGLERLHQSLINHAKRTFLTAEQLENGTTNPVFDLVQHQIDEEFARMADRFYFPFMRFGQFGLVVQVLKGSKKEGTRRGMTIHFETFESEKDQIRRFAELNREYAGQAVVVKKRGIADNEMPLMNFPPVLFDMINNKIDLSERQKAELRQLMYKLAPGAGHVKSLLRKKGTAGYSEDAMRTYAAYFQHLANHVARLDVGYVMEDAIRAMELEAGDSIQGTHPSMLAKKMRDFYAKVMNPGNELAWMRSAMFTFAFFGVLKQGFVNLTQVPMFTYPYLAKRLGELTTTRSLWKMSRFLNRHWVDRSNLPETHKRAFNRAMSEQFMNESAATEMAAVAEAPIIYRHHFANYVDYYSRWIARWGVKPFSITEEYNRRLTFLASFDAALAKGMSESDAYTFAKKAVEMTQFEYTSWNRPQWMRGKKSVLFIFKMFTQGYMYYALTNKGGWRFWALQLYAVGLMGLPGAEHLKDLLELIGTWLKEKLGLANPKLDLEKELRDMLEAYVDNPDRFIHGFSRESLGLSAMADLIGMPFPKLNLNPSLSMGAFLPGIKPLKEGVQGTISPSAAMWRAFLEGSGAIGSTNMNIAQAIIGSGELESRALQAMPHFLRNLMRAHQYGATGAYRDSRGRPTVSFDTSNPEHYGEIIGQALGFSPARIAQTREADWSAAELTAFYLNRRRLLLDRIATTDGDAGEYAKARERIIQFNKTAPPEFRISGTEASNSIKERKRNMMLKQHGLPPTKKYWNLYRDYRKSYGPRDQER